MPQRRRRRGPGPGQQEIDQRVVEMGKEAKDRVAPRAGRSG